MRPSITFRTYVAMSSEGMEYTYEVIKVSTHGIFIPRLVKHEYAFDYETRDGRGMGNNFIPIPREHIKSIYNRKRYAVIANSDSGSDIAIDGVQIKDGVLYHHLRTSQYGAEAIGFKADGTTETYSILEGATGESMVADGVIDSFSFGPLLVRNGNMIDIEAQPLWGTFNTLVSGRQLFGQTITGDIIIISVTGRTGFYGIKGNDISRLVYNHGCHNAIMLDGGGSTQTMLNGRSTHLSSDATSMRACAGYLCISVSGRINEEY